MSRREPAGAARRALAIAVLLPLPAASTVVAQEDFRAADRDRPIRVEDAFPVELRAWEVELGTRADLRERGSEALVILGLEAGLFLDTEVGIELEAGLEEGDEGGRVGIERVGAHLLHLFNRETSTWPALAARVDLKTPGAGEIGADAWGLGLGGIATRSIDLLRLHVNGGYVVAGATDGGDYWTAGLGLDYPLGLFSRALLGDVYLELPAREGRSRVWLELGTRWQLGNDEVLDFGLATRLDEWEAGNANLALVIGVSHAFGIPGLVPVPTYPSPRIR